jgi:opacity protein-like surface antigen
MVLSGEFAMKKKRKPFVFILILAVLGISAVSHADWFIDLENGLALSGYNDVKIPGETGTLFSLSDDLQTDSSYFFRVRLGYQLKDRHTFSVFAAPLTFNASGKVDKEVFFFEETFPPNTPLNGSYTFNSYRLTYRYDFLRRDRWQAGIGFTAKIRDAAVKIEGGGKSSEKTNVGFVPLINFRVLWQFRDQWGLLLEGDAAWSPQGRAEDVLLALQYGLSENLKLKVGYRILEGGADVEEVYNFSLVHFFSAGLTYTF